MSKTIGSDSGISDEVLMAYADGELDEDRAQAVGRAIDNDPELAERLQIFRLTGRALAPHFDQVLHGQPPAAMLNAIRSMPLPERAAKPAAPWLGEMFGRLLQPIFGGPLRWPAFAGLAAGVLIGVAATFSGDTTFVEQGGAFVASGELARTLESQSMRSSESDTIRMISTFQDTTGRWCRLYRTDAHAGLACRVDAQQWKIIAMGASDAALDESKTGPAGGGGAEAVDEIAHGMMASSAALEPEVEAKLISNGWTAE